jgi:hypothetical protein
MQARLLEQATQKKPHPLQDIAPVIVISRGDDKRKAGILQEACGMAWHN